MPELGIILLTASVFVGAMLIVIALLMAFYFYIYKPNYPTYRIVHLAGEYSPGGIYEEQKYVTRVGWIRHKQYALPDQAERAVEALFAEKRDREHVMKVYAYSGKCVKRNDTLYDE